jgi:hypothetical protein
MSLPGVCRGAWREVKPRQPWWLNRDAAERAKREKLRDELRAECARPLIPPNKFVKSYE